MKEYKVWLAKLLTLAILFLIIVPVGVGIISAATGGAGNEKVSVIELSGIIEDATEVLTALYKQASSQDTKAIVLRIDSPGGAVAPSEEIYNAVKRLKTEKPIVVSMGSLAASGGLYAAASASKILCQRGTQTGSIGVIMQIPNYTNIADKVGFSMVTVKSGSMKDAGNPFREMTPEEHAFLEDTAKKVHENFIRAVAEGRNMPEERVRGFADGRVILGSQAKELGLVDGFGDIYDAAKEALKLAGIEVKGDEVPTLVYANKKKGFLSKVLDSTSSLPAILGDSVKPSLRYMAY